MTKSTIDWKNHLATFRESAQSLTTYCDAHGLKVDTFRYHLYKNKKTKRPPEPKFKEFSVTTTLIITRDEQGVLTLSGFEAAHLPELIGAWSHALSH